MNWIRQRREKLGLNQEELAARLQIEGVDVSRVSISNWETGRHQPPLADEHFRKALAKALRLSAAEVLKLAGFEMPRNHTDEAERAANIIDQLPEEKRDLAVRLLEQLLAP